MARQGDRTTGMANIVRFLFTSGLTWAALALHLVICACYLRRWDKLAAITVFPFWAWGLAGGGMALVAWLAGRRKLAAAAAWLWLGTIVVGSDETRPLLRFGAQKPEPGAPAPVDGRVPLRLVTLNCRAGMWHPETLRDIEPWQPDIVLLQEAPAPLELQKFTARLYGNGRGSWAGGINCGLVARGQLLNTLTVYQPYSILATVEIAPKKLLEVGCVHLQGAETNVKLWTRNAFRSHYYNRQSRRSELIRLMGLRRFISRQHPAIIGGDFNAPAGDAVFDLLKQSEFRDVFAEAGSGWPDTYPNSAPMLRIDHLWVNAAVTPVRAAAVSTKHSDHRMVVCDFLVP
jgi:endonuclease/exonuclease/phosphatase (EEP) superfamily protein YafD